MQINRFKLNYFLVCLLVANMLPSFAQTKFNNHQFDAVVFSYVAIGNRQVFKKDIIFNTNGSVLIKQQEACETGFCDVFILGTLRKGKIIPTFDDLDLKTIKPSPTGYADIPFISYVFVKNNKVLKNVRNYEYSFPDELLSIVPKIQNIDQLLATQTQTIKYAVDGLQGFSGIGLKNISTNEQLELSDPLHFLLWNYLRKGTVVKKTVSPIFEVITSIYQQDSLKINGTLVNIVAIKTDGRYYQFEAENGQSVTIDIGFNFVENNRAYMTITLPQN